MVRPLRRRSAVERGIATAGRVLVRGGGQRPPDVFLTRLHVRYDKAHFPEDLVFQETADRANFQGRYILRHPFLGADTCPAAGTYMRALNDRREQEAQRLASLTGWDLAEIRKKNGVGTGAAPQPAAWWDRLWRKYFLVSSLKSQV